MFTVIDRNINRKVNGFVVNSAFSTENSAKIKHLQNAISDKFGKSIWLTPTQSIHITLMDWFAPLVDYKMDQADLFVRYRNEYEAVLEKILSNHKPITVHFNEITVTPSAVIIKGTDNGSYNEIRSKFLKEISLVSGTKVPPQLVHSSIIRFLDQREIESIESFVESLNIDFVETVSEFRLVRERKVPLLEFDVLKPFKLKYPKK